MHTAKILLVLFGVATLPWFIYHFISRLSESGSQGRTHSANNSDDDSSVHTSVLMSDTHTGGHDVSCGSSDMGGTVAGVMVAGVEISFIALIPPLTPTCATSLSAPCKSSAHG